MSGKWHLGQDDLKHTPTGRGFDEFYGKYMGGGDHWNHAANLQADIQLFQQSGTALRKAQHRARWKRAARARAQVVFSSASESLSDDDNNDQLSGLRRLRGPAVAVSPAAHTYDDALTLR